MDLNLANTILGIIASVLSIIATAVALQNKSEIKKLRDSYIHNKQTAEGNVESQVMGSGNVVGNHGK